MDDDELRRRATAHGVADGYHDAAGAWHEASPETLRAVLDALGAGEAEPSSSRSGLLVASHGRPIVAPVEAGHIELEGGGTAPLPGTLPGELPPGYHTLVGARGQEMRLAVCPELAHLPAVDGSRFWGVSAQLYALRGERSWGIGELGDLGPLAAALGSPDFLLLSPLHAPLPGPLQQPSPYYASSRCFLNPLHLSLDDAPEREALGPLEAERFRQLGRAGRALAASPAVERDAIWRLKREALALLAAALERAPVRREALEHALEQQPGLAAFARFCALAERESGSCWQWDAALEPDPACVRAFAYAQLLAAEQRAAWPRLRLGIVGDLAVGADPCGFDAWANPEIVTRRLRLGAPPDELGPDGQEWGLPLWRPGPLAAAGYGPFLEVLRATMAGCAGIRVDHVMGLSRVFVIPEGATPADGTYLRMPFDDLLGLLVLESSRARCLVVGEDLGTVEDGFREAVGARGLLSYRLALFEQGGSEAYPAQSLAAVETHDLPTVAGLVHGADALALERAGILDPVAAEHVRAGQRRRAVDWRRMLEREGIEVGEDDARGLTAGLHDVLARSPAMLACASLEDALGLEQRPNVPGTVDERPNWRLPLPSTIEQIEADPGVEAALRPLRERRGGT